MAGWDYDSEPTHTPPLLPRKQFVRVKGSSYFFIPPLSAVKYIGTI